MKGSRRDLADDEVAEQRDDVTVDDEYTPMVNRASLDDVTSQGSDVINDQSRSVDFNFCFLNVLLKKK